MEKKILQVITYSFALLTIVSCVSICFFPSWKEQQVLAHEKTETELESDHTLQMVSYQTEDEKFQKLKEELYISLPEGVERDHLIIQNNYLEQTVYIRYKFEQNEMPEQAKVQGSSDHIEYLNTYQEENEVVMELKLDKVYELSYSFRDNFLCLNMVDPHDLYDKVIVVDAGHGGRAPGAVKQGVCEKDINLAIVLKLKAILDQEKNIKVYYTRTDDSNPSLEERATLANKANADLFISIHNNSNRSGKFSKTKGTQVLYKTTSDEEQSSKELAQICLEEVTRGIGSRRVGLLKGDTIYIIRTSENPVALIEVGFMTNREELKKLQDEEYQEKVAKSIYNAILRAFEKGY